MCRRCCRSHMTRGKDRHWGCRRSHPGNRPPRSSPWSPCNRLHRSIPRRWAANLDSRCHPLRIRLRRIRRSCTSHTDRNWRQPGCRHGALVAGRVVAFLGVRAVADVAAFGADILTTDLADIAVIIANAVNVACFAQTTSVLGRFIDAGPLVAGRPEALVGVSAVVGVAAFGYRALVFAADFVDSAIRKALRAFAEVDAALAGITGLRTDSPRSRRRRLDPHNKVSCRRTRRPARYRLDRWLRRKSRRHHRRSSSNCHCRCNIGRRRT